MDMLIGKKRLTIYLSVKDSYFSELDEFTYEQGFNLAVGFTAYDSETTYSLPPSIGELVISSYEWGYNEQGTPYSSRKPL